jgi:hypothetical protein
LAFEVERGIVVEELDDCFEEELDVVVEFAVGVFEVGLMVCCCLNFLRMILAFFNIV